MIDAREYIKYRHDIKRYSFSHILQITQKQQLEFLAGSCITLFKYTLNDDKTFCKHQ